LVVLASLKNHARLTAEKQAVYCHGQSLTYAELLAQVNIFAAALSAKGIDVGATVAVSVKRTPDLLPLLLAIWSLRATYVPVDPTYPPARQQYILNDAGVGLLVHQGPLNSALSVATATVDIEELAKFADVGKQSLGEIAEPDDLAYIIYTSGSTGDPKGVAVSHHNVNNFLLSMQREPGLTKDERLLAVTTISFDIHVLELFLPILSGATVVIATRDESRSAPALRSLIKQQSCNVMQATPSTWRMLLDNGWMPPVAMKGLIGGEALPADLLPVLHQATGELWNMYGPTETTVWSTCHLLKPDAQDILIGHAIDNTTLHVVDENLKPVADGVAGELLIGGSGVAAGYYHKPELTAQKFRVVSELEPGVVYRTGDLVVRNSDGTLKYINRIDGQIKIRGHRIEPGDIESCLEQLDAITQAVVVRSDLAPGNESLVCCYLGRPADAQALKKYAAEELPAFMVPQFFLQFDEFPKTENLKINRRALAEVAKERILASENNTASNARNNLDRCVVRVWENILNVPGIGIDDDFFSLGGHSLLALRAVEVMSKATGIEFAPDVIFTSPTIRQILDNPNHGSRQEVTVTKLNSVETGTPIFCLCGMRIYNELAQQFEGENPVYCVFGKQEIAMLNQPRGDDLAIFDSQKFLDAYVKAILRQHPGGSMVLAGFSFGGVLAIEVAQKLESMGVHIESVIMIDSYMPKSIQRQLGALMEDIGKSMQSKGVLHVVKMGALRLLYKCGFIDYQRPEDGGEKEREEVFDFAAEKFETSLNQYNGRVMLVRATQVDFGFGKRGIKDYGWGKYLNGEFLIRDYETDHTGIMTGIGLSRMCQDIALYLTRPS